jgi:hypothetical protein
MLTYIHKYIYTYIHTYIHSGAGTIGHGRARAPPLLKLGGHGGGHIFLLIYTRIYINNGVLLVPQTQIAMHILLKISSKSRLLIKILKQKYDLIE